MNYKDLSRAQQAIIIAFKYGQIPKFVRKTRATTCTNEAKQAVQDKHMAKQKKEIGGVEARKAYWIDKLKSS